jgi:Cu/Ag efflux protein CusF
MKRAVVMMAMAMLMSAGLARAQESVTAGPASPVAGGKVIKSKTMTAVGAVTIVTADSLAINDGPGKDWTFAIDAKTKIIPRKESINVAPTSPVEGGKVIPGKPPTQETVEAAPASPIEGGKVIPSKAVAITDIREGQRVQVTYHTVDGKMHATQVRVM